MKTHKDLIDAWGGLGPLAEDMDVGYGTVASWSHRNAIPHKFFPMIVVRAPMRGLDGVTLELLYNLKRGREHLKKGAFA